MSRKQQLLHSRKEIGSTEASMSLLAKVGYRRRVQRINERNKFIRKSIHEIERSFVEELLEGLEWCVVVIGSDEGSLAGVHGVIEAWGGVEGLGVVVLIAEAVVARVVAVGGLHR